MKKLLVTLIAVLMVIFTGCGSKEEAPKEAAAQTEEKETVVGFIYVSPADDGGWSTTHNEGRLHLEQELGVKTLYRESVPEGPEVKDVMRNMIQEGANVIIAASFGYMDYMEEMSEDYPEVTFLHCSGYKTTNNMSNFFGRIYQARYLSGIVAGMKTENNKIGYVAAFPIPEVIRGINAFTLGAQAVNPDVTVEVVWTNTWYDPAKEKDAAIAVLDNGVDIIAQHQDTAGPQHAAQERGVWSIGYHADMSHVAPKANMTSAIWNWGPFYVDQIKAIEAGTWTSEPVWTGLESGVVTLAPLTDVAPEGAQKLVDEYTTKITNGEFDIFSGEIKDQEGNIKVAEGETMTDGDMLSMNWFVEGVIGRTN